MEAISHHALIRAYVKNKLGSTAIGIAAHLLARQHYEDRLEDQPVSLGDLVVAFEDEYERKTTPSQISKALTQLLEAGIVVCEGFARHKGRMLRINPSLANQRTQDQCLRSESARNQGAEEEKRCATKGQADLSRKHAKLFRADLSEEDLAICSAAEVIETASCGKPATIRVPSDLHADYVKRALQPDLINAKILIGETQEKPGSHPSEIERGAAKSQGDSKTAPPHPALEPRQPAAPVSHKRSRKAAKNHQKLRERKPEELTRYVMKAIEEATQEAPGVSSPKEVKNWVLYQLFFHGSTTGPILRFALEGIKSLLQTRRFNRPKTFDQGRVNELLALRGFAIDTPARKDLDHGGELAENGLPRNESNSKPLQVSELMAGALAGLGSANMTYPI